MMSSGRFGLHLLQRLDSEHIQAALQDFRGQIAEKKTCRPCRAFGFQYGASLEESREVASEFVEVIAKIIGPVFLAGGLQDESEIQELLGQRQFFAGAQVQFRER